MQERALLRGWIARRSVERRRHADTPVRVLGGALCAYGEPLDNALAQRGTLAALSLRVLMKPNRSRKLHKRQSSPSK